MDKENEKVNFSINNNSTSNKSFLALLLEIFDITFSSSQESNKTLPEQKRKALENIISIETKNVATRPFLSIQNISSPTLNFSTSIKEDLKFLLIKYPSEFLIQNERNFLIRLLCQIINSIHKESIELKLLNVIYATITSALFSFTEKTKQILISFIYQLTQLNSEKVQNVFTDKIYSDMIKEEKDTLINEVYHKLMSILKKLKMFFEKSNKIELQKETQSHLNVMYSLNGIQDETNQETKKEKAIVEVIRFININSYIIKDHVEIIQKYIDAFKLLPFDNTSQENLGFVLKHIANISYSDIVFYSQSCLVMSKQIMTILSQNSFRINVSEVFASTIIQDYYQLRNEYKEIQERNTIINSKDEVISNVNIMSEGIIKEYYKFSNKLKNETFRNDFFEKNICVGRIAKSLKAFTTRYLQILINYSGIEKNEYSGDLSKIKKEDFSQEELAMIDKDKNDCILDDEDKQELIFLKVLKSLLLLIIIHEFNHYVRRIGCINEDISKCSTDIRNIEEEYEGGEHMFKHIFGVNFFEEMSYEKAVEIYNINNWKGKITFFTELFGKKDGKENNYVLKFMESKRKHWHCVEGYEN